jgi:hypothetical protein
VRKELAALAVLYLLAHLLHLPPTLEDVDSINFAMGVRDFDVARHQPHPPGYPVFIALGKISTAALRAAGVANPEPRALALLSALAATALIPLLFALFRRLADDDSLAWWGMAVAICSPLLWFTALRPLSDMTGLALAVASQVCLLSAIAKPVNRAAGEPVIAGSPVHPFTGSQYLFAGAALCGLAAGIRAQTVMLTAPVLVAALVWPNRALTFRARGLAAIAALAGVLVWAVPLIAASGGLGGYLAALGSQAGEDFSGVVMLWTMRQARVAAEAVQNTFVWPWAQRPLANAVLILAALGAVRFAWRAPRGFVLLAIAFLPYAVFHLLFHETATVRYAAPLIVPVALLAMWAAGALGRLATALTAGSLIVASLVLTLPAARAYAANGSPAFQLFQPEALAMMRSAPAAGDRAGGPASVPAGVLAMHAVMDRAAEWEQDRHGAPLLRGRHGHEWLSLVEHWRNAPDVPAMFAADPRRTDLALFDPHDRVLTARKRWTFPELPFIAGIRPGNADGLYMRPPGWMLEGGWALTAEVAGVTARDRLGPHVQPSVAWIRARSEAAALIVGGRHVGGDPPARLTLSTATAQIDSWTVAPGFFFRHVALPPGTLSGTGYVPLRLSALAADGSGRQVEVKLEQFDVQSNGVEMLGYIDGWQEPEYNPRTSRSWRWMSERARLWVRPVGRDVALTLTGESPLRYFDEAPTVRILAAGAEVARFSPVADFEQRVVIPARALTASGGLIAVESSLWFTPAERGEGADRRHLALRIYSAELK